VQPPLSWQQICAGSARRCYSVSNTPQVSVDGY
jgi:hypothetical protein